MIESVSDGEFYGQAVLVTGGASGMSWAVCERFATRGAAVLIANTNTVLGAARAADLQARGARGLLQNVISATQEHLRARSPRLCGALEELVALSTTPGFPAL